jgi:hypothetical protein
MINLSHMISILNFVFIIFSTWWEKKTRSHFHIFWRVFKSKIIWIKFLIFSSPKFLPCFYFLSIFQFGLSVFLLLSFWPISYYQPYFFAGPVSNSAHQTNFLWSSLTSRHQLLPSASPAIVPLFAMLSPNVTVEPSRLLRLFPFENGHTPSPPLPRFHLS